MGIIASAIRSGTAAVSAMTLLASTTASSAPESRLLDTPSPVTTIGAKELERLPVKRDLKAILDIHNRLRKEVGSRPLNWNPESAARADEWAQRLASTGQLEHSPRSSRPRNERENLAIGVRGVNTPIELMQTWVDEKKFIDMKKLIEGAPFPTMCKGDWNQCAHLTQVLWSTTTDVGCGFARGARFDALVCRYSPPGNADGKPAFVRAPIININNSAPINMAGGAGSVPLEDILSEIDAGLCPRLAGRSLIGQLADELSTQGFSGQRAGGPRSAGKPTASEGFSEGGLYSNAFGVGGISGIYVELQPTEAGPRRSQFERNVFCYAANLRH